jgi:hypothetical protein
MEVRGRGGRTLASRGSPERHHWTGCRPSTPAARSTAASGGAPGEQREQWQGRQLAARCVTEGWCQNTLEQSPIEHGKHEHTEPGNEVDGDVSVTEGHGDARGRSASMPYDRWVSLTGDVATAGRLVTRQELLDAV